MSICLFIIYLLAGCFFLSRIKFIKDSGLSLKLILALFLIKIAAGVVLGLINHYFLHNMTDYDGYNILGMDEYHILMTDPHRFFTDIFHSNYNEYGDFFGSSGSYWNDLRTNIIFKVLAFMNILSRGNYYINSLFFNFFCFFGHVALYRIFIHSFPGKKWAVIIGCFLLPSLLYFSSGIHKDLIVFTSLAIFCYSLYVSLDCGFSAKRIFFLLVSFLLVLAIRNFIAVMLLPFALAWFISAKYRIDPIKTFTATIVILFAAVFLLHNLHKADPLVVIAEKQQSFLALGRATTQYDNDTLAPTIKSYLTATPKAIRHGFFSPYPGELHSYMNLFSLEMVGYVLLVLLFFLFPSKEPVRSKSFIVFCLVFSFFVLLFSGYITPAAGALIRYRSIYLPFLITPILASINWKRFQFNNTL